MSKTLTFEIPDEIYEVLEAEAARSGRPAEAVVLEWLARQAPKPRPKLTAEEQEAAEKRLERHFGTFHSGNPRSADNEQIDADLEREYGSTHEEEP